MSYKISKELFEAVMNIEPRGNTFRVESKGMYYAKNYYTHNDFFFMCKEWALGQGYIIQTELEDYTSEHIPYAICRVYFDGDMVYNNYELYEKGFQNEQQAVFDACQYILVR